MDNATPDPAARLCRALVDSAALGLAARCAGYKWIPLYLTLLLVYAVCLWTVSRLILRLDWAKCLWKPPLLAPLFINKRANARVACMFMLNLVWPPALLVLLWKAPHLVRPAYIQTLFDLRLLLVCTNCLWTCRN